MSKTKHVTVETRMYLRTQGKKLDTRRWYDEIIERHGFFITKKDGLYGLVSPDGYQLLQRRFTYLDVTKDGYVIVRNSRGYFGLRDTRTAIIFPCIFTGINLWDISGDVIQVQLPNKLWALASISKHQLICEPKYARLTAFHGEYCAASFTPDQAANFDCLLDHQGKEEDDLSLAPELAACFNKQ